MNMTTATAPASLDLVRDRLAVRRRRELARRWGLRLVMAGWLALATTITTFVADFLFDLGHVSRLLVCLGSGLLFARLGYKRWWPVEITRHRPIDWALLVEREQSSFTPLVAALQFADGSADGGSASLKQAVIEGVGQSAQAIDPLGGFTWHPLPRRGGLLLVVAGAVVGLAALFPAHASAFASRMLLRDVPYPTRTRIIAITINGRNVAPHGRQRVRVPAGAAVLFNIQIEGERPAEGSVSLADGRSPSTRVELSRVDASSSSYQGQMDTLDSPRIARVRLGDSRPPAIELVPIPRPVLTTHLNVTPPAYARGNAPPPPGARTAAVLRGTTVELSIRSEQKPLHEAAVELFDAKSDSSSPANVERFPLQPSDDRRTWRLDPAGTRLSAIDRPVGYRVIARDEDGLSPARQVAGLIELREDRPPKVTAEAVVQLVLPTATPKLRFAADDDFGVAAMNARLALRREGSEVSQITLPLPLKNAGESGVSGEIALTFTELEPQPGDKIEVIVEAIDERGSNPGQADQAESIMLEVTDRAGFFSRLREADETAAEQIDAIIQQQLGIGDEP